VNRRKFLVVVGAGAFVTAAGVAIGTELMTSVSVGAEDRDGAGELVVNGSFEDGSPGAEIFGWAVLA
jgi:hypothetical protein